MIEIYHRWYIVIVTYPGMSCLEKQNQFNILFIQNKDQSKLQFTLCAILKFTNKWILIKCLTCMFHRFFKEDESLYLCSYKFVENFIFLYPQNRKIGQFERRPPLPTFPKRGGKGRMKKICEITNVLIDELHVHLMILRSLGSSPFLWNGWCLSCWYRLRDVKQK